MTFLCSCCNPPVKFTHRQNRWAHQQRTLQKRKEGESQTDMSRGRPKKVHISEREARLNSRNSSRASSPANSRPTSPSHTPAEFVKVVEKLRESNKTVLSIRAEFDIVMEKLRKSPHMSKDNIREELRSFTQMKNWEDNESIRAEVESIIDREKSAITGKESEYSSWLTSAKESFKNEISDKKVQQTQKEILQEKAKIVKSVLEKRDDEYVISNDELEKALLHKIQHEKVVLEYSIKVYEKEISHRKRVLDDECFDVLKYAITPDEKPAVEESQDCFDWNMESVKKARRQ